MNLDWYTNIIMEYQKTISLLGNISNQPSKFWTKSWVEINDDSRGMYDTNSQIKFKTAMLKWSLWDYSDAYILVKGSITITEAGDNAGARQADERSKGVIWSWWQYCRDEPNDNLTDSESFKSKKNNREYSC